MRKYQRRDLPKREQSPLVQKSSLEEKEGGEERKRVSLRILWVSYGSEVATQLGTALGLEDLSVDGAMDGSLYEDAVVLISSIYTIQLARPSCWGFALAI